MANPNNNEISKPFLKSFGHAYNGIKHVFKNEKNFRLHTIIAVIVLFAGFYVRCSLLEIALLVVVISLVLVTEMINSAIEYTWDKLEPNHHPIVGVIKDVMAGSVLVASVSAVVIGLIIICKGFI